MALHTEPGRARVWDAAEDDRGSDGSLGGLCTTGVLCPHKVLIDGFREGLNKTSTR